MFPFLHARSLGTPLFPVIELSHSDFPTDHSSFENPIAILGQGEIISNLLSPPLHSQPLQPTQELSAQPERSSRVKQPPIQMTDFVTTTFPSSSCTYLLSSFVTYSNLTTSYKCALSAYSSILEPSSFHQASQDPAWINVMKLEIVALEENEIWSIVDLPAGKTLIQCKWVYKVKYKASGEVERYQARLVAKGYSQKTGLDYSETFSPVAKMVTVRSLIVLAAFSQWFIYQMDVHIAFLNGDLLEEVYMTIPEGFARQREINKVWKLHKSLYGLKQAPRQWNKKLTYALI